MGLDAAVRAAANLSGRQNMKHLIQSVAQRKEASPSQKNSAGPKGMAGAPPAYGIELADRPSPKRENRTGLPDRLKAGIEALSGLSMDAVRVHYNSPRPAELQALAYTQGPEIHVAPGQEGHLAHEAWHVVQQAQGRVRPTVQTKAGMSINKDPVLEHEADMMGAKALQAAPGDGIAQRMANDGAPQSQTPQLEAHGDAHNGDSQETQDLATNYFPKKSHAARPQHWPAGTGFSQSMSLQLVPKDINRSWTFTIAGDKIVNSAALRNTRSVAWPLNKLTNNGLDSSYLGGHLFKAEYGGHDDITNVVPWIQTAENKYATFEKAYKRGTEQAAAAANSGAATTTVDVSASFKDEKYLHANDIKGYRPQGSAVQKPKIAKIVNRTLSLIPVKVSSKDSLGNAVQMGSNDLGHVAPNPDGLQALVQQPDTYLVDIETDVDRIESLG
jgi:Domain of unknown function (DUF4157)